MAGYSVSQLADFLNRKSYQIRDLFRDLPRTKIRDTCNIAFSIDDISDFLIKSEKYSDIFYTRLDNDLIQKQYRPSAKLLKAAIEEKRTKQFLASTRLTTTRELFDFPGYYGFNKMHQLRKMCRDQTLLSYKKGEAKTDLWQISVYSFGLYLRNHPEYVHTFETAWEVYNEEWKRSGDPMYKLGKAIKKAINRSRVEEDAVITISVVSDILDIPENQVNTIFQNKKKLTSIVKGPEPILVKDLIDYILEDETRFTKLRTRWITTNSDDPLEPILCRLVSHATARKIQQE